MPDFKVGDLVVAKQPVRHRGMSMSGAPGVVCRVTRVYKESVTVTLYSWDESLLSASKIKDMKRHHSTEVTYNWPSANFDLYKKDIVVGTNKLCLSRV